MPIQSIMVLCLSLVLGEPSSGVTQWRGAERQAVFAASWLPADLGAAPKRLWQVTVGEGHASPLVAAKRAYSFTRVGSDEKVACYDLGSGKQVWQQSYAAPFLENAYALRHGKGPKATPLLVDDVLVTVGVAGEVSAWRASDGKRLWQNRYFKAEASDAVYVCAPCGRDCDKKTYDKGGECPGCQMALRPKNADTSGLFCGVSSSPMALGDLVVTHVGNDRQGAVVARKIKTGKVVWSHEGASPGYASPQMVDVRGVPELVTFTKNALVALNPKTGALNWSYPFDDDWNENIATPLQVGKMLVIGGPRQPLQALRVTAKGQGLEVAKVWQNDAVNFYMSSPVAYKDSLFGFSKKKKGQYVWVDGKTGAVTWESAGRMGDNASLWLMGDVVAGLDTDGQLKLFQIKENAVTEVGSYEVADSATWAHMAPIQKGRFLVKDASQLSLWGFE